MRCVWWWCSDSVEAYLRGKKNGFANTLEQGFPARNLNNCILVMTYVLPAKLVSSQQAQKRHSHSSFNVGEGSASNNGRQETSGGTRRSRKTRPYPLITTTTVTTTDGEEQDKRFPSVGSKDEAREDITDTHDDRV